MSVAVKSSYSSKYTSRCSFRATRASPGSTGFSWTAGFASFPMAVTLSDSISLPASGYPDPLPYDCSYKSSNRL